MITQYYSPEKIRAIFRSLEEGNGTEFFTHVADKVDWTVEGHHPLAGHYHSKADFLAGTFDKLAKVLPHGTQLHVTHTMVCGDWAIVELASLATAKNGLRFDNKYCWLCKFENELIVVVRAYLDSAMVQRLFDENQIG
jgi:ketosteroid isomerase-like protein